MILNFVIFFVINVVSSMKSIQKIPPKYSTKPSSADLVKSTRPSDNSFPEVVYPTSILDIANPYYSNTDNYEVLEPFSDDVKSSYKLLSSIMKSATKDSSRNIKNKTEIKKAVIISATDAGKILSVKENMTEECHNDNKDNCINTEVKEEVTETHNNKDMILDNTEQNYDFYNVSLPQKEQNESSKIPLLVKINLQVFKEHYEEIKEGKDLGIANNLTVQDNEENTIILKQVKVTSSNESSEETNSSSEEHTELQDIKHSDFIKMLSVLLFDLLDSTDNNSSEIVNTTTIENDSGKELEKKEEEKNCIGLERIVLDLVDNVTNSEAFDLNELSLTDLRINKTRSDFEDLLNLTEFRQIGEEYSKESKEGYFLDLLVSLDSLCENNKTVETVADSEYLINHEYLPSENCTDTYE